MTAKHDCYPLAIHLPDGTCATALPGSRPPRYFIGDEELAIDVEIPADLVETGWFWSGSTLLRPGADGGPGVAITTCTFGIPGVFEQARKMEQIRAEHEDRRAGKMIAKQLVMEF